VEYWLTIEVADGAFSASSWRDAHGDSLSESAVTNGVRGWSWHDTEWGVVLEIEFRTEADRERFRALPAVRAALDAVPDPVGGLYVYPGRGGGAGAGRPRRPRPAPAADAIHREPPIDRRPAVEPLLLLDVESGEYRRRSGMFDLTG
jgi:hypothetical protein